MECDPILQYRIDCGALAELKKIPCIGAFGNIPIAYWKWDYPLSAWSNLLPELERRIKKIMSKMGASGANLHIVHDFGSDRDSYYLEVDEIRTYVVIDGVLKQRIKILDQPICFSIGTFTGFWDYPNQRRVSAASLMTSDYAPFHNKVEVPGVWDWIVEKTEPYDWEKEYGPKYGLAAKKMKQYITKQKADFLACKKKYYPQPTEKRPELPPPRPFEQRKAEAMKDLRAKLQPWEDICTERPQEKDLEKLKKEWVNEYGYTIRVPNFDQIVHLKPKALRTPEELKFEARQNLQRILDSPAPGWARSYSTVMTWIDNIQDTSSIVYPALKLTSKIAPRAFSKILPVLGWMMLGYDILDFANAIGRAPLSPMKSKRASCQFLKHNPFSRAAQAERKLAIKNFTPRWSDLFQAAQVTNDLIGVGIALGSIMGFYTDCIFGAYRYLNGEPIRFTFNPPEPQRWETLLAKKKRSFAAVATTGQTFDEVFHTYAYIFDGLTTYLLTPLVADNDLTELIDNPHEVLFEADRPTDQATIEAIQEAGLDIEDGVRFPWNGKKEISSLDFFEITQEEGQKHWDAFAQRHKFDEYGLAAAEQQYTGFLNAQHAVFINEDIRWSDALHIIALFRMLKAPVLPTKEPNDQIRIDFNDWITNHYHITGHVPGVQAIEDRLKMYGLSPTNTFPQNPTADTWKYFPKDTDWGQFA
jgi:hypothetical protein